MVCKITLLVRKRKNVLYQLAHTHNFVLLFHCRFWPLMMLKTVAFQQLSSAILLHFLYTQSTQNHVHSLVLEGRRKWLPR